MAEPQSPQLHKIGSLPMCIGLDRSGSTYGDTLQAELEAVEQICFLRQDDKPVSLIPWCDSVSTVMTLDDRNLKTKIRRITSDGGTDPAVLYESGLALSAMREAGIWVLMTDGQIADNLVENFATKTSEVGLHNKPCIVVVFGHVSSGRPAACDISVGIAVYAVVPDCIFLFHDIPSGIVRILQAKGRFRSLLPPGQVRLVISQYTAWSELPRLAYEDLFRIEVAKVRDLHEDEIALQDGLIVNMNDMMAGKLDPSTVEKVLKERDNRRSIVLAARTKGTGKTLAGWLKAQQKTTPGNMVMLEDVDKRAQNAITKLLAALRGEPFKESVTDLRGKVRAAHESNVNHYWQSKNSAAEDHERVQRENERLQRHAEEVIKNSHANSYRAERVGYASGRTTPVQLAPLPAPAPVPIAHAPTPDSNVFSRIPIPKKWRGKNPYKRRKGSVSLSRSSSMTMDDSDADDPPLFIAGYRRADPVTQFKGRCMLCHTTSALSLLLRLPPPVETPKFPGEGQGVKIAFPLAMGNFPELDVVSHFVCCDACAFHLVNLGRSPNSETVISAICLVNLPQNMATMLETVDQAVRGRFESAELLAIFIAMLDATLVKNEIRDATQIDKDLFRAAARWTLDITSATMEIPSDLSPAFASGMRFKPFQGVVSLFSSNHFAEPIHVRNTKLLLLRYPIAGFMVLLRLMRLTKFISDEAASSTQVLVFQRIVFHLIETEINHRSTSKVRLPIAEMLDLRPTTPFKDEDQSTVSTAAGVKKSIAITELAHYGLLDQDNLKALQTEIEFKALEDSCGPALAVFLHWMARDGVPFLEPVSCFNALKAMPLMKNVVKAPLAISDGLAADYIAKIWGRA